MCFQIKAVFTCDLNIAPNDDVDHNERLASLPTTTIYVDFMRFHRVVMLNAELSIQFKYT